MNDEQALCTTKAKRRKISTFIIQLKIRIDGYPPKRLMNVDISIQSIPFNGCLCIVDNDWNYFRDICCDRSVTCEFIFVNASAVLINSAQPGNEHIPRSHHSRCTRLYVFVFVCVCGERRFGTTTTKNSHYFNLCSRTGKRIAIPCTHTQQTSKPNVNV